MGQVFDLPSVAPKQESKISRFCPKSGDFGLCMGTGIYPPARWQPRRGLVNFARPRPRRASRKRVGLDRRTPKTTCQASNGIEKPTQHTVGTVVFYQPLTYEQSKFNNRTDESANIMLAFIDMKTPCGKPWLCDCKAAKKAAEAVPLMCAEGASPPVAARNDIGKRVDLDDCSRAI